MDPDHARNLPIRRLHVTVRCLLAGLCLALLAGCPGTDTAVDQEPARPAGLASETVRAAIRHRDRGLAYLEQDKPARAAEEFRALVELVPGEALGPVNLAIAYLRLQEPDEAARWAERAVEEFPGQAAAWETRALVREWQGRLDETERDLRRALQLDPDSLRVRYRLARRLLEGDAGPEARSEALALMEELSRQAPGNVVVLTERALALVEQGRPEGADVLDALAEAAADEGEAGERLLQARRALGEGRTEEALRDLRVGTNLLRGREIYRLSSAAVRAGIVGWPLEEFTHSSLRRPEVHPPEEARVRFRAPAELPPGASRTDLVGSDGGRTIVADLDDDGELDEIVAEGDRLLLPGDQVLEHTRGIASVLAADLDHDGDLDLLTTSYDGPTRLWRNDRKGRWTDTTLRAGLHNSILAHDATAADLDGDTDLDLVFSKPVLTIAWNLRLGRFELESRKLLATHVAAADFTQDGCMDLVFTGAWGAGVRLLQGTCSRDWRGPLPVSEARATGLVPLDHDNDGFLDLLLASGGGPASGGDPPRLLRNMGPRAGEETPAPPGFTDVSDRLPESWRAARVEAADVDGDGDQDLVEVHEDTGEILGWLSNEGGNARPWVKVRLQAAESSGKNNRFGLGSRLELRAGDLLQVRTVRGAVTHFGLGAARDPQVLRVIWTNGVPQSRLDPPVETLLTEEEVLKGSCPFLYAWDGDGFAFVTDLLWAAPLGLPLPVPREPWQEPLRAGWDSTELVRIDLRHTGGTLRTRAGLWELRITEELWETAYFDQVELVVVDHPPDLTPLSNLKIQPPPWPEDRLRFTRDMTPPAAARDEEGRDVWERLQAEDARFLTGGRPAGIQGLRTPHALVLEPPRGGPFDLLLLTGWIFPTDASLNTGLAHRRDRTVRPPVLEYADESGWRPVEGASPYPPGKTKTVVLDLPPEARGRPLRLRTNLDIRWDRAAFGRSVVAATEAEGRDGARVRALAPVTAVLRRGGFHALWRESPAGPHLFDYGETRREGAWPSIEGPFTRYGSVEPLLATVDDRLVVMGPGDELALAFDAEALPEPPRGWKRSFFLRSTGWDKDADLNTLEGGRATPYPCHGMSDYPPRAGECPPGRRLDWLQEYQTRPGPPGMPFRPNW